MSACRPQQVRDELEHAGMPLALQEKPGRLEKAFSEPLPLSGARRGRAQH